MGSWSLLLLLFSQTALACKKDPPTKDPNNNPTPIQLVSIKWNDANVYGIRKNAEVNPTIRIRFSNALDTNIAKENIKVKFNGVISVDANYWFENNDSTIAFQPNQSLKYFSKYVLSIPATVKSHNGGDISAASSILIRTTWDPSPKFDRISTEELMNSIQKQTFSYFWDYAHPTSRLAR